MNEIEQSVMKITTKKSLSNWSLFQIGPTVKLSTKNGGNEGKTKLTESIGRGRHLIGPQQGPGAVFTKILLLRNLKMSLKS